MQNKSVLISIQPKWCELILRGKKTLEVRKTKPNLKPPFKVYIYCTKAPKGWVHIGKNLQLDTKVIGEFTCKLITPIAYTTDGLADVVDCRTACMKPLEFLAYGKGDVLYGWHISDLKVYDKPKELSEFYKPCIYAKSGECIGIRCDKALFTRTGLFDDCGNILSKAPQSWCYVEELESGLAPASENFELMEG